MERYTREQLEALGMNEQQIDAILSLYGTDDMLGKRSTATFEGKYNATESADRVDSVDSYDCLANSDQSLGITTIVDLQKYASGTVVRFPDFAEGQPFVARVRRPSMLVLAKSGKIPNSLLTAAGQLFTGGGSGVDADNADMLAQIYDICKIICEAALIQPTMKDIESAGMSLSDDQLMAIFNYTQSGIKALESFRKE